MSAYVLFDSLYWVPNPKSINKKTQICPWAFQGYKMPSLPVSGL